MNQSPGQVGWCASVCAGRWILATIIGAGTGNSEPPRNPARQAVSPRWTTAKDPEVARQENFDRSDWVSHEHQRRLALISVLKKTRLRLPALLMFYPCFIRVQSVATTTSRALRGHLVFVPSHTLIDSPLPVARKWVDDCGTRPPRANAGPGRLCSTGPACETRRDKLRGRPCGRARSGRTAARSAG